MSKWKYSWKKNVLSGFFILMTQGFAEPKDLSPSTSAGVLEKQVQQEFKFEDLSPVKEIPLLEVDIPPRILDIPEGISVVLEKIEVEGNTVLSEELLAQCTDPYTKKEVSGADIKRLCLEIDALYAKHGYILAWTYPPVQKIKDGILVLKVLEGMIEDVEITGNRFYKTPYISRYFAHLKGRPFNYADVLKALMLANENFKLSVKAILKKGKEKGSASLVLKAEDELPLGVSAGYNNWGSNATTYNQMASEIDAGNLLMSGDKLTVMTSFGLPPVFYYLNPVYSIPINSSGARLSLSYLYSFSNIQQQKQLDLTGWSEIGTVAWNQPLARTRKFNANIYASFDVKQMKNLQQGQTVSLDKLRVLSTGGSVDYIDSVHGRSFFDTYFHIGIPEILGGSRPEDPLCSRPGAGGRYFIVNTDFQRLQTVLTDYLLVFSSSAQGTFNKLPLGEQLNLGGEGTIRGYPSGAASGDIGYYTNTEFYIPPPFIKDRAFTPMNKKWKEVLQLLVFLDHGGVYTNAPVYGEASPAYLTSIGAGFRFYGPRGLRINFDAAFPITSLYKQFNSSIYFRIYMNLY